MTGGLKESPPFFFHNSEQESGHRQIAGNGLNQRPGNGERTLKAYSGTSSSCVEGSAASHWERLNPPTRKGRLHRFTAHSELNVGETTLIHVVEVNTSTDE